MIFMKVNMEEKKVFVFSSLAYMIVQSYSYSVLNRYKNIDSKEVARKAILTEWKLILKITKSSERMSNSGAVGLVL